MEKGLILTSTAFAFFIVCPRMAGMIYVICKNSNLPLIKTALIGSVIAIPLILLMVWIFSKFGVTGALLFCVATDLLSAVFISNIGIKAGIETLVIALFVLVGVKVAPLISSFFK
ncbi:MAG: hypothetical protein PVH88_22485 [Ignavibacteria bacterium]|jgi:hypothetical protein